MGTADAAPRQEHGLSQSVICRYSLALSKIFKINESRAIANAGLAMEADNKELLNVKKSAAEMILIHFTNASSVDFRMDESPSADFMTVCKVGSTEKAVPPNLPLNPPHELCEGSSQTKARRAGQRTSLPIIMEDSS